MKGTPGKFVSIRLKRYRREVVEEQPTLQHSSSLPQNSKYLRALLDENIGGSAEAFFAKLYEKNSRQIRI